MPKLNPLAPAPATEAIPERPLERSPERPPEETQVSYEVALGELERLVGAMEAGQLPLDRLLENYRRGAELLALCRSRLEAVEQQVRVLEEGQLKVWGDDE